MRLANKVMAQSQAMGALPSLYAATAALMAAPLISWNSELIQRAGALSPSTWMAGGADLHGRGDGSGER